MASMKTLFSRPPHPRGQGAVEAIVTLPVFLILVWILFQIFFLGLAQVQLRYAAFCAARVGAVRDGDIKEMKAVAGKVLSGTPGAMLFSAGSYRVEELDLSNKKNGGDKNDPEVPFEFLRIRVHWDYPLFLPFLDTLWAKVTPERFPGKTPKVPLHASWTTIKFKKNEDKTNEKKKNRT